MNIIAHNRKARFEYEILESIEVGIVLLGDEIKSIVNHKISIDAAFATVEGGNVTLHQCNIESTTHEPQRNRRLLLNKKEIEKIAQKALVKGFTLIPLSVYIVKNKAKIELAVCKGKHLFDKRQSIKTKDLKRESEKE